MHSRPTPFLYTHTIRVPWPVTMVPYGKRVGGEREQVPLTLKTAEFVRRWCLHIQPGQLTKTRAWGGWSNTRLESYREQCWAALRAAGLADAEQPSCDEEPCPEEPCAEETPPLCCEHCGSESLVLIKESGKPTWEQLLRRDSECSPGWYAESQKLDDIRFWDAAMGEGFSEWYEWYLESEAESAKEPESADPLAVQGLLPGFESREAGIGDHPTF